MGAQANYIETRPMGYDMKDKYQFQANCPLNFEMAAQDLGAIDQDTAGAGGHVPVNLGHRGRAADGETIQVAGPDVMIPRLRELPLTFQQAAEAEVGLGEIGLKLKGFRI